MGVQGLWRLLLPIGRRISIETLEGRVLAVDASIWLTQFLKAMRDPDTGKVQPAAHLIGFIRRLCRLRFHGIRAVLVFDGPTPAIKRREIMRRRKQREQFATLGPAGVQRLARRLLAQTLQQQQQKKPTVPEPHGHDAAFHPTSSTGTAQSLAPGFNPGGRDGNPKDGSTTNAATLATAALSNDPTNSSEEPAAYSATSDSLGTKAATDSAPPEQPAAAYPPDTGSDAAIAAALEFGSDNENNTNDPHVRDDDGDDPVNDWDLPLDHEATGNESSNSDDPVTTNSSSLGFPRSNKRQRRLWDERRGTMDVAQIAALPPGQRRDAIEAAKRTQRLLSRREFMPAAANPDAFSSVQVTNFLRSIRLNQSIHAMALRVVHDEEKAFASQPGEFMASDRNTRVSLIREDDPDDNDRTTPPDAPRERPSAALRARQQQNRRNNGTHRFSHRDSSSDEDSQSVGIGKCASPAFPAAGKKQRRAILDEEDDYGDSSKEEDRVNQKCTLSTNRAWYKDRPQATSHLQPLELDDSSEDDDSVPNAELNKMELDYSQQRLDSSVGFRETSASSQPPNGDANWVRGDVFASLRSQRVVQKDVTILTKPANALELVTLPIDSTSGNEMPLKEFDTKEIISLDSMKHAPPIVLEKESTDENSRDFVLDDSQKPRAMVNMSIKTLLRDSATGLLSPSARGKEGQPGDGHPSDDKDSATQFNLSANEPARSNAQTKNTPQSVVDKQIAMVLHAAEEAELAEAREAYSSQPQDKMLEEARKVKVVQEHKMQRSEGLSSTSTAASPQFNHDFAIDSDVRDVESEVEEDNVDWEDGETSLSGTPVDERNVEWKDNGGSTGSSDQCHLSSNAFHTDINESLQVGTAIQKQDATQAYTADGFSTEAAAALERAQGTAANLANWAGRAFRRAMNEVHAASPSKQAITTSKPRQSLTLPILHENRHRLFPYTPTSSRDHTATDLPKEHLILLKQGERGTTTPESSSLTFEAKMPFIDTDNTVQAFANNGVEAKATVTEVNDKLLLDLEKQYSAERNQRERDMETVTDEMKEEIIKLLQLFGIPYVEAPSEAEAQCAALEELGLVDGIVTEDSDVFVFGGQVVYKNIFEDKMYAEAYLASDAKREMGLGRNAMVALAMLLGSDYTDGVKGVGIVNAMEVLQVFDVSDNLGEGLTKFRQWLDGFNPFDGNVATDAGAMQASPERRFHSKHKSARTRWIAPDNFPAENVMHAFLSPVVDKSSDRFTWGIPDVQGLIPFCARHMGWTSQETRRLLDPVMDKINDKYRQTRIDSYMAYEDSIKFADVRSKRLRDVLGLKSSKHAEVAETKESLSTEKTSKRLRTK